MGINTTYAIEVLSNGKWKFHDDQTLYDKEGSSRPAFCSILGGASAASFMKVFPRKKYKLPDDLANETVQFLHLDVDYVSEYYCVAFTLREINHLSENGVVDEESKQFIGLDEKIRILNDVATLYCVNDDKIRLVISFD
jgi:hypothetical protein